MIKKMIIVVASTGMMIAMDQPGSKLAEQEVRKIVHSYITNKEGSYIKDSHRDPKHPSVLPLPAAAISMEMGAALISMLDDSEGYACADNKIFKVGLDPKKKAYGVLGYTNLETKVDPEDATKPVISALKAVKALRGAEGVRVLLGEIKGRILVANPESHEVNTFGQVNGRIGEFKVHPEGTFIAAKYASLDSQGLVVPCLAASKAYLLALHNSQSGKEEKRLSLSVSDAHKVKRRSWMPQGWQWSAMVTKPCEYEVLEIGFTDEYITTVCSHTKVLEKWKIIHPETEKAELFKVEDPSQP